MAKGAAAVALSRSKKSPVDTLFLKIAVTPLLMWLVSTVARRRGNFAGGLAAGLPITSGPISVYLALDNGTAFAAQAAFGSLVGLAVVTVTYVAYSWSARWQGVPGTVFMAALAFAGSSLLLHALSSLPVSIVTTLAAMVVLLRITQEKSDLHVIVPSRHRWDMPARIAASLLLVLCVTAFADVLGPHASGYLSPIPVVAWPLIVFAHARSGCSAAQAAIRGTSIGIPSVLIFYAFVLWRIDRDGLVLTFALAFLLSGVGVLVGVWLLRIRALWGRARGS